MRAAVISLFCATALAVPSAFKHHHHAHKNVARNYVMTTVVVTEVVTQTWSPEATAVRAADYHPAHHSHDDDDATPPVYGAPPKKTTPKVPATNHSDGEDDHAPVKPAPEHKKKPAPKAPVAPKVPANTNDAPDTKDTPDTTKSNDTADSIPKTQPKAGGAPKAGGDTTPATTYPKDDGSSDTTGGTGSAIKGKNMVIFGDNLSDRGNGSVDHNVAGGNTDIYTYRTWTNGKIAAEVLAENLNIPIKYDYAFGHSEGGSKFGATVDNLFTQSNSNAPSCADQIKNYTSNSAYYNKQDVADSVHFLWCGNNDVLPWAMPVANSVVKCNTSHIFTGPGVEEGNNKFAKELAMIISVQVQSLLDAGAKNIFVPNIYPRHLAPVVSTYFVAITKGAGQVDQYGDAIKAANTELKRLLTEMKQKSGANIVYYDAFNYLVDLFNNRASHGFKHGNVAPQDICDDGKDMDKLINCSPRTTATYIGDDFYWMEYLDMSAKVHKMLAGDMANALNAAGF